MQKVVNRHRHKPKTKRQSHLMSFDKEVGLTHSAVLVHLTQLTTHMVNLMSGRQEAADIHGIYFKVPHGIIRIKSHSHEKL